MYRFAACPRGPAQDQKPASSSETAHAEILIEHRNCTLRTFLRGRRHFCRLLQAAPDSEPAPGFKSCVGRSTFLNSSKASPASFRVTRLPLSQSLLRVQVRFSESSRDLRLENRSANYCLPASAIPRITHPRRGNPCATSTPNQRRTLDGTTITFTPTPRPDPTEQF